MVEHFVYPVRKDLTGVIDGVRVGARMDQIGLWGNEQEGKFGKVNWYFKTVLSGTYIVKGDELHVTFTVMPRGWDRNRADRAALKLFEFMIDQRKVGRGYLD